MKRLRLTAVAAMIMAATAIGFAADKRPEWTKGYFDDLTNSYITTSKGTGNSREEARNNALKQVDYDRSRATGLRTEVRVSPSGDVYVSGSDNLTVKARVIDEYAEVLPNAAYEVYVLVQVANNPGLPYESVTVSEKYKFSPSVFVPGMAQIAKGSVGKGAMFIALEAAGIGAIVYTECERANYASKINKTHNAKIKQRYIDKANNWETGRNISIAATCAIYAWNVIDGIVAKGKKHVVADRNEFAIAPYWSPEGTGIALNFTF